MDDNGSEVRGQGLRRRSRMTLPLKYGGRKRTPTRKIVIEFGFVYSDGSKTHLPNLSISVGGGKGREDDRLSNGE